MIRSMKSNTPGELIGRTSNWTLVVSTAVQSIAYSHTHYHVCSKIVILITLGHFISYDTMYTFLRKCAERTNAIALIPPLFYRLTMQMS